MLRTKSIDFWKSSSPPRLPKHQEGRTERELIVKIHEICDDYTTAPTLSKHTGRGVVAIVGDLCQKYLAAPAAPSERGDEREEFEQMCKKRAWVIAKSSSGKYLMDFVQHAWVGWQARAGLSSQEGK